jgi:5'-deoxynucleotidase YfbR-like HD superfamily hydrolase
MKLRTLMSTHCGNTIDFKNVASSKFDIRDIAHGLSQLCRFAGQCNSFYSVAEHSLYCERRAWYEGRSALERLQALLHDAPEAYTADIPSPFKRLFPEILKQEAKILKHIYKQLLGKALPGKLPKWLKHIDDEALAWEKVFVFAAKRDCAASNVVIKSRYINKYFELLEQLKLGGDNERSVSKKSAGTGKLRSLRRSRRVKAIR